MTSLFLCELDFTQVEAVVCKVLLVTEALVVRGFEKEFKCRAVPLVGLAGDVAIQACHNVLAN